MLSPGWSCKADANNSKVGLGREGDMCSGVSLSDILEDSLTNLSNQKLVDILNTGRLGSCVKEVLHLLVLGSV